MGQTVSALKCCFGGKSSNHKIDTMTNTEDDRDLCNEEPFGEATFKLSPLAFSDQYDMQEKLEKLKGHIEINADGSITLRTDSYADGYETIQQCFKSQQEERLSNASASEAVMPVVVDEQNNEALFNGSEHTEGATDISQPPPPPNPVKHQKRNRYLIKNLTPQASGTSHSGHVVDQSLSQKLSVDEHLWHYVSFEHALKVEGILTKNKCDAKLVPEFSNEGVSYSLEVSPYMHDSYNETDAKNAVDNAAEEFAGLFQKLYNQPIMEDSVKLPPELDKEEANGLAMSLKNLGFLLIESDLRRLIGPEIHLQEAKNEVWEVISKHQRKAESALKHTNKELRFESPNGLSVFVSQGDLLEQRVDAIVNPANRNLSHGGGAARAISKAAGHELEKECRDFISRRGPLSTTFVMHSTAGKLRPDIKFVIHAVGPRKSDSPNDEDLYQAVKTTVYNCLHYANSELKIQSVAIPAISSGIFGVPLDIVAKASFDALVDFDKTLSRGQKVLREIHFLNNDKPTASGMRTAFAKFTNKAFGSSVDPISTDNNEIILNSYAAVFGRQRIPTKPDKNCFVMAIATALQRDLKRKIDWQNVEEQIKRELKRTSKLYKDFQVKTEGKFTDWLKNFFKPSLHDSEQNADLLLSAAANALEVEIILVQVNDDKEPFERNFKPQSSSQKSFDSIYISCDYFGHSHFDALVKNSEVQSSALELRDGSYAQNHGKQHLRNSSSVSNSSGKIPEKIKPINFSSNNGSSDNMNAGNNPHSSKEDNMCIICMDEITDVKELPCKHRFCRECIDNCFEKHQPKCPSCGKVFGVLKGNQPPGTMTTRENKYQSLPGYGKCGIIEIQYSFQNGTQKENHPNPGQSYRGTTRTAFLPANKEGREVLVLLRRAFESKLLFTIGRSNTTGHENVVIWNDVHHKTSISGQYGYPDATYLKRVKEELAAKGIQ